MCGKSGSEEGADDGRFQSDGSVSDLMAPGKLRGGQSAAERRWEVASTAHGGWCCRENAQKSTERKERFAKLL